MAMKRYMIKSFLEEFYNQLDNGDLLLVKRPKNIKTLISLGYNLKNLQQELSTLTIKDYHSGPEENEAYDGHVMVFGKTINNREVYIKLSNTDKTGINGVAVCISFHFADYPLTYPLK